MIAAIVPAAGLSVRMGRPKLLLDVGGRPLILRVVSALGQGGAGRVVVVAGPEGQEGAPQIVRLARDAGASAVHLDAPTSDMRATIERGLDVLAGWAELPEGVLIAPGDSVGLCGELVAAVVARFRSDPSRIVVPVRDGTRGHPLALPWSFARMIRNLPRDVGVNALLDAHAGSIDRLPVAFPGLDADLDTPEDYRRWADPDAIPNSFGFDAPGTFGGRREPVD